MLEVIIDVVRTGLRSDRTPFRRVFGPLLGLKQLKAECDFVFRSNVTNTQGNKRLRILHPVTPEVEPPERRAKIDKADRMDERRTGRFEWFSRCRLGFANENFD
jgi:hypothetical protein